MLSWEMITLCFEMYTKYTNELFGHKRTVEYEKCRHKKCRMIWQYTIW